MNMNPANRVSKVAIAIALFVSACGIIKNDDHEKDVRAFLTNFEASLTKPAASLINDYFHTSQEKRMIIDALIVLQNRDSSGVKCKPNFALSAITFYAQRIEVKVPVSFADNGIAETEHINTETTLTLWVERTNNELRITEIDGSDFYQTYTAVKNYKKWSEIYKKEIAAREVFYTTAAALEKTLDSVIWFANSEGKSYYYAVNGTWQNYFMEEGAQPSGNYRMGLVSAEGDTLIPFEYELIGTIGFIQPSIVEVKLDGKYGYFDLDSGKVVIEPMYDMIIPYEHESNDAKYLVLQDTTYGWLAADYTYTEGYPSQHAIDYAFNYIYLQNKITLKAGNQVFCEIPSKENIGYGIVIPPSYYVKNKIFDAIVGGINTTQVPMNGWTDYIESAKSVVARIGEGINAIVSVLSERYIGGREEFYGSSQVTFVNGDEEVMATTEMPTDQEVIFTHIDGVLELKATGTGYHYWTPGNERDIPVYKYFKIVSETELAEMESKRVFNFTEFVKLDSSYITGTFAVYDESVNEEVNDEPVEEEISEETQQDGEVAEQEETEQNDAEQEVVDDAPVEEYAEEEYYGEDWSEPEYTYIEFLTLPTLRLMRDEIGAVNGLRPADSENASRFEREGYSMQYNSIEEVLDSFNEIDRHNWIFLNRVIEQIEGGDNAISGI
jgi:hypothetical protein